MWQLVDLGTRFGGGMVAFQKHYGKYFPEQKVPIYAEQCIGYDVSDDDQAEVESQGFKFGLLDLSIWPGLVQLPLAEYYSALHILEHLPNRPWSSIVVKLMLCHAQKGCWFRLPSFEQESAEARLKEHDLRFAWTDWIGHPSHYLLADLFQAITEWGAGNPSVASRVKLEPLPNVINDTADDRVVPIGAPVDTIAYSPEMGVKAPVTFNPPIVTQYDVFVMLRKPELDFGTECNCELMPRGLVPVKEGCPIHGLTFASVGASRVDNQR